LGTNQYLELVREKSARRRLTVAVMTMVFQQWTGVNFILYYAPFIFGSLGLAGSTTNLLASGVVGAVMFLATIPAVIYVDQVGRKPILISGAIIMGICHFVVGGIIAGCQNDWPAHAAAGWVAVVFVWFFAIAFGYSWGPVAWIIVSESFSVAGLRAKGISIGASANWLMNFTVAISTPDFVAGTNNFGCYFFLGAITFIGAAYIYFLVPETKGKSLEELDAVFGDSTGRGAQERAMMERIGRDVGLYRLAGIADEHNEKASDTHSDSDKEALHSQ